MLLLKSYNISSLKTFICWIFLTRPAVQDLSEEVIAATLLVHCIIINNAEQLGIHELPSTYTQHKGQAKNIAKILSVRQFINTTVTKPTNTFNYHLCSSINVPTPQNLPHNLTLKGCLSCAKLLFSRIQPLRMSKTTANIITSFHGGQLLESVSSYKYFCQLKVLEGPQ